VEDSGSGAIENKPAAVGEDKDRQLGGSTRPGGQEDSDPAMLLRVERHVFRERKRRGVRERRGNGGEELMEARDCTVWVRDDVGTLIRVEWVWIWVNWGLIKR